MMTAVKNHWITGLTLLGSAFMLATGIGMLVSGGEFNDDGIRVFGGFATLAGLAILAGLWGLRSGKVQRIVAHGVIVVGMLVLGVGYWWFVFVPPVLALAVLWAGVVKQGLVRELHVG